MSDQVKARGKKRNVKLPYHKYIATGGDPSKYSGSQGLNKNTVNDLGGEDSDDRL